MNKVKIMLSCLFVVAIAATALAFKARVPNVCIYTATYSAGDPAISTCPSRAVGVRETAPGAATQYATTIPKPVGPCPATTTCGKAVITIPEN